VTFQADATQGPGQFGGVDELSPTFFDGMEAYVSDVRNQHFYCLVLIWIYVLQPSPMDGAHPHSSSNGLLARLSSLVHRFRPNNGEANEHLQPSRPSAFYPHALLARLSSLIYPVASENDAPSMLDPHVLLARISSLFPRSRLNTDEEAEPHLTTPLSPRPDAIISRLSSLFRSRSHINNELELSQRTMHPPVVEVAAVRDKQVCLWCVYNHRG